MLLQGYPNLEYMVVDGGSNDGTLDVIRRYQPHLAWWVSERDRGQSHALNKGFARATGDIFAYLNSDDVFEPGALFACAAEFRAGARWTVGKVHYWTHEGELWPVPELPGHGMPRWLLSCPVAQPGSLWSAELHRVAGEFREDLDYLMDYDFWLRLRLDQRIRPRWVDRPIARYRLHPASKTIGEGSGFAREAREIVARFEHRLNPIERAWLSAARRRRIANVRGREAVQLLRQGSRASAARRLLSAFAAWPLVALDPRAFAGLREWLRHPDAQPDLFPPYW